MRPSPRMKNAQNMIPLSDLCHQSHQLAHGGNHPTSPALHIHEILRSGH